MYTGTVSYGLYLLHKLPFDAEQAFRLNGNSIFTLLMGLAASYFIVTVSWFMFERPILKLKRFFESPPLPAEGPNSQFVPEVS